jgi:hypothetical protein
MLDRGYNTAKLLDCILFLFALMTTIMTDLQRTTLHCNIAASSECICFLLLPFWTCVTCTRKSGVLTMHSDARLASSQISPWIETANTASSARKLALGRKSSGRSFLERKQPELSKMLLAKAKSTCLHDFFRFLCFWHDYQSVIIWFASLL